MKGKNPIADIIIIASKNGNFKQLSIENWNSQCSELFGRQLFRPNL